MADKIQIKRSTVADKKPTPEQLAEGELALNLQDEKIYAKNADGVVKEFPKAASVDVGVESVNDITGEVDINGSDNVSVTKSGQDLTLDVKDTVALKTDVPAQVNLQEGDGIEITGTYPNQTITNEVTDLGDLSSVTIDGNTGIAADSVLTWNGTAWVPADGGGSSNVENLPDLGDVTFPTDPVTGQILQYSDGQWKNVDVSAADGRTTVNTLGGPVTIKGTAPITVASPTPNDDNEIIIGYSGTQGIPDAPNDGNQYARQSQAWSQVQATGGGKETLAELTDTTISNPDEDQFLRWSGDTASGKWVNEPVTLSSAPDDAQKNVQSDWNATEGDALILNKPTLAPSDAEKNVQSNWTEETSTEDAFILNKPTKLSDFQDDLGYTDTDTGIVKLTHGGSSVTGGDDREVTFKSSDASVQFALNASNEIDFTVPLAGLNIKGVVQYALPQTQADGRITVNGTEYEVLWDPATYLDDSQSGVVGAALGDLWIIQYQGSAIDEGTVADGNGYVYSLDENGVAEWSLVGPIQGPPGENGSSFLPISSTDNKVTLSDSDGTFLVQTGDTAGSQTTQLVVSDDGVVGVNIDDPNLAGDGEGIHIHADVAGQSSEIHMTSANTGSAAGNGLNIQMGSDKNVKINNRSDGSIQMLASNTETFRVNDDSVQTFAPLGVLASPVPTVALHVSAELNKKASSAVVATLTTGSRKEDTNGLANAYGYYSNHVVKQDVNMDEIIGYDAKGVTSEGSGENRAEVGQYIAYRARSVADGDALAATGFQSNINGSTSGDSYQVDAAGNAPSRFAGQVQTNTITTKDAATKTDTTPADPVIDLSWSTLNGSVSSPAIAFRAGYYNNAESVVIQQGDGVAPDTANRMNYGQIVSVANNEIGTADDPAFAGMTFRHTYASGSIGTIGVRQTYVDENASTKAEFAFIVRNGNANLEVLTVNHQDIRAKSGYEPQTDSSLVTKGWVTGGGTNSTGGYLPLAGGTMDIGGDVLMPSGRTDAAQLQVGGAADSTFKSGYNIVARGAGLAGDANNSVQIAAWAMDGARATFKLATGDGSAVDHYWNITHKMEDDDAGNATIDNLRIVSTGDVDFAAFSVHPVDGNSIRFSYDTTFLSDVITNRLLTNNITTKDAALGDGSIVLSDGAVYIAGTDINETESPRLYFRGHTSTASSVANLGYIQATVEDGSGYKGTLGFWSAIGGAPYYRDEPDFSITSVGQLHAATTYEPADDNSLVTKSWVLSNTGSGGFPIVSEAVGRVEIQADDDDGTLTFYAECTLGDADADKTVPDNGVYTWYANGEPENPPAYGSPGAPALVITQQGVLETASGTLRDGRTDYTGMVTGFGLEGIRNSVFYPHVQRAHDSRGNGDTGLEWDEVNYHFMRERNALDNMGASLCEGFLGDNTSQGCVKDRSLFTIREGGLDGSVHITTSADYTPIDDFDIVTKKYFDDNRVPLPNPDVPIPPVGSGAGYTWDQLERTPGLYLSGVYGIDGIYSIIGFSDMQAGTTSNGINMDLMCYWSTDGRTWTEGFVGGNWVAGEQNGNLYEIPTPNNAYGKYCDGTQVIFTGNAFTSTGKTWQGFNCDMAGQLGVDRFIGDGVPIYWDSGIETDQAIDPNTGIYPGTLWPEGPVWVTSRMYLIEDLEDDETNSMVPISNNAVTTQTDVQLTNSRDVTCPKVFFSAGGNDDYYFSDRSLYKPLQSEAVIRQANKTDTISTYFAALSNIVEYADACCSPDGKTVLALDSSDNQFYWFVHKRTTLTVPSDLWQVTGLCCAYDRSRGYFAAATSDTVRVYEAPYTSGTYAYGGRLIATYTIPQAAEWTHLSISGGVYLLMSKSGAIARLDTNNPANTTFEMMGANSPAVFSANPVLAGTNGRFLITGGEDVNGLPDFGTSYSHPLSELPTDPAEDQRYAWSGGDNDPGAQTTTGDIDLTNPEDPNFFTAVEREEGRKSTAPKALLTTQEDANQYFAEEIAENAGLASDAMNVAVAAMGAASSNSEAILEKTTVVTLTQAEYDALGADVKQDVLYLITV